MGRNFRRVLEGQKSDERTALRTLDKPDHGLASWPALAETRGLGRLTKVVSKKVFLDIFFARLNVPDDTNTSKVSNQMFGLEGKEGPWRRNECSLPAGASGQYNSAASSWVDDINRWRNAVLAIREGDMAVAFDAL